jgi:hypothetical protein
MESFEKVITKRDGSKHIVLVSAADRRLVEGHKWHIVAIGKGTYASAKIDGKTVYLHRLVLGLQPGDGLQADHINRNGLDNRRENLRPATDALNRQNFSAEGYSNNKSGYRGVHWLEDRQRWGASCCINGKQKRIGRFKDVHEAGRAVAEYRRQHMPYANG